MPEGTTVERNGSILESPNRDLMPESRSADTGSPVPGALARNIPHSVKNSPQLRVLVVDDEPLIRWSLLETLEQSGHAVIEAGDRASALRSVGAALDPFDVVLLDYRLPDSNDLELLATIRRLAPASAVIMMTAFGTPEVTVGALQLGAFRVIAKPFEVDEMAALVLEAYTATER